MQSRRVESLARLDDRELFAKLAQGMNLLHRHASHLHSEAETLRGEGHLSHGGTVLHGLAEEEAAKFLILLDAARCPKHMLEQHLRNNFYSHLARLLYADVYGPISTGMGSESFGRLKEYLEQERRSYYLDDPGVLRNSRIWARESALYVDYVEETSESRYWTDPLAWCFTGPPAAFNMVEAMVSVGFATPEALAGVAETWRGVAVRDDMPWTDRDRLNQQTLEKLNTRSLLRDHLQDTYSRVIDRWQFPLYGLDLREKGRDDLRKQLTKQYETEVPEEY